MRCLTILLVSVLILYVISIFNYCKMEIGVHPLFCVLWAPKMWAQLLHTPASSVPPATMLPLPHLHRAASCWVFGQKGFGLVWFCLVWIQNIGREKWGCCDDTLTTIPGPLEPACGRNVEELELWPREVLACCKQSSMGRADPSLEGKEANRDAEWRLSSLGLWGEQGFSWEWGQRPFMLYSDKESRSVSWKPEWGWIQKQWTSLSDRGNFKTA